MGSCNAARIAAGPRADHQTSGRPSAWNTPATTAAKSVSIASGGCTWSPRLL